MSSGVQLASACERPYNHPSPDRRSYAPGVELPDITQLPVGHQFAPFRHELLPEKVAAYVQAVEEINPLDAVPPLALAAYALGGVLGEIVLPPGSVHAAQEVSFSGAMFPGDTIAFTATLTQNSLRGGWRFLVIDFVGASNDQSQVVRGKSTVLVPEDWRGRGGS